MTRKIIVEYSQCATPHIHLTNLLIAGASALHVWIRQLYYFVRTELYLKILWLAPFSNRIANNICNECQKKRKVAKKRYEKGFLFLKYLYTFVFFVLFFIIIDLVKCNRTIIKVFNLIFNKGLTFILRWMLSSK